MTARRILTSSWPPMIGGLLGVLLIVHNHDVSARDLVTFCAYLALAVALPGVFCWRLVTGHLRAEGGKPPTWFEDLSLGTIFGFGIQLPFYLVGVWINVPRLFLVVPLVVLVLSAAAPFGRRAWTTATEKVDVRVSWALALVIVYAVGWLARYVFPLRPLTLAPYKTPTVDETFHEALISELLHRFPPEIPFLLGTPLDYHWFTHAQMAADHWATGLASPLMLRELMPVATIGLTVLGLGAVALRLSGRAVAAVIAPALLVAGGFNLMGPHYSAGAFSEPFMSPRYITSPSQAYGFMMALPAILLILEVLRPDRKSRRMTWLALALALLALAGSKATFMPIFLGGAVALGLTQLVFRRTFDKTVAALAALLLVMTIFAQVVLYGGSTGGLRVDYFLTVKASLRSQLIPATTTAQVVMTVTLLVGWLLYGAGAVGLFRSRLWRDPRAVWMAFCVLGGIAVAFVFFRSGHSQLWFQRSVAELVVLLSAWGLVQLLPDPLPKRLAGALLGVAAAAGLAAFLISAYAETGNRLIGNATYHEVLATALAPIILVLLYLLVRVARKVLGRARPGPLVLVTILLGLSLAHVYSLAYDTVTQRTELHPPRPNQFAPGGVQASAWIADHSDSYDIVATNVHCRKPDAPACDNRNFWISAYTERRVVIEGWGYTSTTNAAYADEPSNSRIPAPDPERLKINDAAFTHPTAATVKRLVDTYDVKFLFVSKRYPVDLHGLNMLKGLLTSTYQSQNYAVFKVR